MRSHRVLLLLVLVPIAVAVHALGAVTLSGVGHDQPVSIALGGLLVIAVVGKLVHLVGFGALGVGVLKIRALVSHRRRRAPLPASEADRLPQG